MYDEKKFYSNEGTGIISLVVSLKKFTLGLYLIFSTKMNSIKTKNVNVRYEEIKVLEEAIGEYFHFWDRRPVQHVTKSESHQSKRTE